MKVSFREWEREDGSTFIEVRMIPCPICQREHSAELLPLESPLRVKLDHQTFRWQARCAEKNRYVLLNDWKAPVPQFWVTTPPPEDLLPRIEKRDDPEFSK